MTTQIVSKTNETSILTEIEPSLKELRDAIDDSLFRPSLVKSIFYFVLDVSIIAGLLFLAIYLDSWYFYPVYWFLQGTFMWALFVVGHDCGHGSFSRSGTINEIFGILSHTVLLVPFHGWKVSHRTHHNNTGNPDRDESWYPLSESEFRALPWLSWFLRYKLFLVVFPVYLVKRSTGRDGSHFLPGSELFQPQDKYKVLLSTTIWTIFFSFLVWAGFQYGFYALLNLYIIPYYIFVVWLSLVTFLHHTDTDLPWYRDEEWNFVKGAVSTKDRSYGIFEPIHHNIGTHIVHHLFPKIPHYNLKKATEMVRPILGNFYKKTNEPLWKSFYRAYKFCHYIPDNGKKIYYTSDAKGKS